MATLAFPIPARKGAAAVAAAGILVGGWAAVAHAAGSSDSASGVIHACSKKSAGDLRIIAVSGGCKSNESALQWNVAGPAQAPGVSGPAGTAGPRAENDTASTRSPTSPVIVGTLHLELYSGATEAGLTDREIPLYSVGHDSQQTLSIGSQGTGAGAGRVVFNPLTVTLPADATLPLLFKHEASGVPFKRAVVTLFDPGTTTPQVVDIYGLTAVKSQSVAATASGRAQTVSFEYGYEGHIVGGTRAGWDRVKNVPCAPADPGTNDPCIPV